MFLFLKENINLNETFLNTKRLTTNLQLQGLEKLKLLFFKNLPINIQI